MAQENDIGLQPHKAAVLVQALRSTASDLAVASSVCLDALCEGAEDVMPAMRVTDAALFLDGAADDLQRILEQVVEWFAAGSGNPLTGIDVWSAPYDASFDDPRAAYAAATTAVGLWDRVGAILLGAGPMAAAGDAEADVASLEALLERWRRDPAFATTLAPHISADTMADLLRAESDWHRGTPVDGRASSLPRNELFVVLSTASMYGGLAFTLEDVVRALCPEVGDAGSLADVDDLTRLRALPLAFAFSADTAWSTGFLEAAADAFVLPLNRALEGRIGPPMINGVDARVAPLEAIARDGAASRSILLRTDLADLFAGSLAYDDGGHAVTDVLRTATAPRSDTDGDAASVMARFTVWAVQHPALPPVTLDALGLIAAPWISCFRSESRDLDGGVRNPLHAVTDENRVRFLALAARTEGSAMSLKAAELHWAATRFDTMAVGPFDGAGLALVANVDQRVGDATWSAYLDRVHDELVWRDIDRRLWQFAVSLSADAASPMVSAAISAIGSSAVTLLTDDSTWAFDEAKAYPRIEDSDVAKLETMLVARLWSHRADNHVFDGVADPPSNVLVGEPRRLLAEYEMTQAQLDDFRHWLDTSGIRARAHFDQLTVRMERTN